MMDASNDPERLLAGAEDQDLSPEEAETLRHQLACSTEAAALASRYRSLGRLLLAWRPVPAELVAAAAIERIQRAIHDDIDQQGSAAADRLIDADAPPPQIEADSPPQYGLAARQYAALDAALARSSRRKRGVEWTEHRRQLNQAAGRESAGRAVARRALLRMSALAACLLIALNLSRRGAWLGSPTPTPRDESIVVVELQKPGGSGEIAFRFAESNQPSRVEYSVEPGAAYATTAQPSDSHEMPNWVQLY